MLTSSHIEVQDRSPGAPVQALVARRPLCRVQYPDIKPRDNNAQMGLANSGSTRSSVLSRLNRNSLSPNNSLPDSCAAQAALDRALLPGHSSDSPHLNFVTSSL